jgi:hypothetical protein
VKKLAKQLSPQMNLSLLNPPAAATLPDGKQEELSLALIELLISGVAEDNGKPESKGGRP